MKKRRHLHSATIRIFEFFMVAPLQFAGLLLFGLVFLYTAAFFPYIMKQLSDPHIVPMAKSVG